MTKNFFFIGLAFLTNIDIKGQIVGFKIKNQISSISSISKRDTTTITKDDETIGVHKTLEIINYNYKAQDKKTKEDELTPLVNELYRNSKGIDSKSRFDDATIKKKSDRIKILTSEIKTLKFQQDSLYFIYTEDLLNYKNFNILLLSPLRSRAFFDIVYANNGKRFKALGNTGLNFGNNTASIYSELVSGNLGLLRVGLGTMVTSNNNEIKEEGKKEEAYQRLVTYGGNTILSFDYPFIFIHTDNNQYNLISKFSAKGTSDLPAFGTTTEDWAGSASIGVDFYGDAALSNNTLKFFFNFNYNKIYGTDIYRDNLGIENSNFTFGQLSLGLVFLENFKISFIVSTWSSESILRNRNIVAGGQVLR